MARTRGSRPTSAVMRASLNADAVRIAEQAVEDAWQELAKSGSPAAQAGGKAVVRELMAQRVFSQAGQGELDPDRLKQIALWALLYGLGR